MPEVFIAASPTCHFATYHSSHISGEEAAENLEMNCISETTMYYEEVATSAIKCEASSNPRTTNIHEICVPG